MLIDRRHHLILVAAATALLTSADDAPGQQLAAAAREREFFGAAVHAVAQRLSLPLLVDTRTLVAGVETTYPLLASAQDSLLSDTAALASAVRNASASVGDGLRFVGCPGQMLVRMDSTLAARCPQSTTRALFLAASRLGGAKFPNGNAAYAGALPDSSSLRTVRGVILTAGPRGSYVETWDFVFGCMNGAWRLFASVPLYIIE